MKCLLFPNKKRWSCWHSKLILWLLNSTFWQPSCLKKMRVEVLCMFPARKRPDCTISKKEKRLLPCVEICFNPTTVHDLGWELVQKALFLLYLLTLT